MGAQLAYIALATSSVSGLLLIGFVIRYRVTRITSRLGRKFGLLEVPVAEFIGYGLSLERSSSNEDLGLSSKVLNSYKLADYHTALEKFYPNNITNFLLSGARSFAVILFLLACISLAIQICQHFVYLRLPEELLLFGDDSFAVYSIFSCGIALGCAAIAYICRSLQMYSLLRLIRSWQIQRDEKFYIQLRRYTETQALKEFSFAATLLTSIINFFNPSSVVTAFSISRTNT